MHPLHQLLHQLHAYIQNEGNYAAKQAECNENHFDIVLDQVDVHGQLLNFGCLVFFRVGILLRKILVLHPGSGALIEKGEPN